MKKLISKVKKVTKDFFTNKSAFSLVELIVVIAIMAVMAAVLAPSLLGYVEKSRMQKDDSAMDEITNAIQLSLADMNVYDEALQFAVKDNYSCYCDGDASTNTDANKITTKEPDLWLFNDNARLLDETVYKPAGKMRGVTITLKPNGSAEYILKDGIVNQIGDESTKKGTNGGAILEDCSELYNRLRSTVGDTIKATSQTYRNSDYTIFISMGTTGGNQADKQDAIQVYGQYNGTILSEVAAPVAGGTQGSENLGGSGSDNETNDFPSQPTPVIKTFRLSNVEYQYEEGMTWKDWVESDYGKNFHLEYGLIASNEEVDWGPFVIRYYCIFDRIFTSVEQAETDGMVYIDYDVLSNEIILPIQYSLSSTSSSPGEYEAYMFMSDLTAGDYYIAFDANHQPKMCKTFK